MINMKNYILCVFMVVVQLAYGVSNILVKIAFDKGLSYFVLIVYRHLLGMVLMAPLAYAFERKHCSSLSFGVLAKIFVLASLGISIMLTLLYMGLDYTSATVVSALYNVVPGLTFILSVLLRMEKVQTRCVKGLAKVFGAVTCIGGALMFTLWKGYMLKSFVKRPLIIIHGKHGNVGHNHANDWIKGSALIVSSCVAWSASLIVQAKVYDVYPAQLSTTTLMCCFGALQCSLVALVFDRNPLSWRLHWDIRLVAIIYGGVVLSCLVNFLQIFCISKKGPLFSAIFSPLMVVFVGVFSTFVFAERLYMGSLIGTILIIIGLYCVVWGKSKDGHDDQIAEKLQSEKYTPPSSANT